LESLAAAGIPLIIALIGMGSAWPPGALDIHKNTVLYRLQQPKTCWATPSTTANSNWRSPFE
jgi:hypothetical protein